MKNKKNILTKRKGLYAPDYEHDACGVGMIVHIHGEKSHDIVESALRVLEYMRHRGGGGGTARITRQVLGPE
jgi:glutamate synthase (NADPH/NADH) large chain